MGKLYAAQIMSQNKETGAWEVVGNQNFKERAALKEAGVFVNLVLIDSSVVSAKAAVKRCEMSQLSAGIIAGVMQEMPSVDSGKWREVCTVEGGFKIGVNLDGVVEVGHFVQFVGWMTKEKILEEQAKKQNEMNEKRLAASTGGDSGEVKDMPQESAALRLKLQEFLPEVVSWLQGHEDQMAEHLYYLKCLMKEKSDNAPKDLQTRFIWDVSSVAGLRGVLNRIHELPDVIDDHVAALFRTAIKKARIYDVSLHDEKMQEIEQTAKDDAKHANSLRDERLAEEQAEREKEQQAVAAAEQKEVDARAAARKLYRGFADEMKDKDFDKFHSKMESKTREDNIVMTQRDWLVSTLTNKNAYPVLVPKSENRKPFDTYKLEYLNERGSQLSYDINKAFYLYAVYLHGKKRYLVEEELSGNTAEYETIDPISALREHLAKSGQVYNKMSHFTSGEGICVGSLMSEERYTVKEIK